MVDLTFSQFSSVCPLLQKGEGREDGRDYCVLQNLVVTKVLNMEYLNISIISY